MVDNGLFPEGYNDDIEPANMHDLESRLSTARASLSSSKFDRQDFKDFRRVNQDAATEADVMSGPFSIIASKSSIPKKQDVWFNSLAEVAPDIQKGIKVDYYNGSVPSDIKRSLRELLSEYIVPSTNTTLPILPNFFVEAKDPDGNVSVVKRQALHNGVIGARGFHKLREHAEPRKLLDERAYTITSTYSGRTGGWILTLYTLHPTGSKEPAREHDYHITTLGAFAMDGDPDSFRKGASTFRNPRD